MRAAFVTDTRRLELRETEDARPLPSEALVRVKAISLNRGEVRRSRTISPPGARLGWDVAGIVEKAAADGTGPKAGERVVGMVTSRGWAELVAVPSNALAVLPANISFAQASCLPVAGLTALHALGRGGNLVGKKVLVTGASGGVGHFACRLGRLGGAQVTGVVRDAKQVELVQGYGAQKVAVVGDDPAKAAADGPFDLIIESVAGASLAASLTMLSPGGECVFIGISSEAKVTFDASKFFWSQGASLYALILFREVVTREPAGVGLKRLLHFVADGSLKPDIALERPWEQIDEVAEMLMQRAYPGKAVLHL